MQHCQQALGVRSVASVFSMSTIFSRLHFSGVLFLSLVFDSYDCELKIVIQILC